MSEELHDYEIVIKIYGANEENYKKWWVALQQWLKTHSICEEYTFKEEKVA